VTTTDATSAPPTIVRRTGSIVLVVVGVLMLVVLAASLLLQPRPRLAPSRYVGWQLADGFLGTPRFDPTTAATTTEVQISVDWLTCAPQADSWLAPPEIEYTRSSVIITMHTTDAFAGVTTCGGGNVMSGDMGIMLDVGIPIAVHLKEPLAGRALLDGGPTPPRPRPYP
jgi:hypothetical protein